MRKTWFSKADCSSIPSRISIAVLRLMWFFLRKMPNTPEQLQTILEEIIATETDNDFITFEIKNVAPIAVAKKYAGIGASIVAKKRTQKTLWY